ADALVDRAGHRRRVDRAVGHAAIGGYQQLHLVGAAAEVAQPEHLTKRQTALRQHAFAIRNHRRGCAHRAVFRGVESPEREQRVGARLERGDRRSERPGVEPHRRAEALVGREPGYPLRGRLLACAIVEGGRSPRDEHDRIEADERPTVDGDRARVAQSARRPRGAEGIADPVGAAERVHAFADHDQAHHRSRLNPFERQADLALAVAERADQAAVVIAVVGSPVAGRPEGGRLLLRLCRRRGEQCNARQQSKHAFHIHAPFAASDIIAGEYLRQVLGQLRSARHRALCGFVPLREALGAPSRVAMSAAVVTSATDSCFLPELSMRLSVLAAAVYAAALSTSVQAQDMTVSEYPETRRGDVVETLFGEEIADPYRWLEDDVRNNPEVADWVERQNAVTDAYLAKLPARDWFKERIGELYDYERFSTPVK